MIHGQQRVIINHIAELLGRPDMDAQGLNIERMRYLLLSAQYETHSTTSCLTMAFEAGNSSPKPLSFTIIIMVLSSEKPIVT